MSEWKVMLNVNFYQVWRQTRPLRPGEPMHSGVRETRGYFERIRGSGVCGQTKYGRCGTKLKFRRKRDGET